MTNKYKVGTVLVSELGNKIKIIEVLQNVVLLETMSWWKPSELDKYFTIEKEDWRPEVGGMYWIINDNGYTGLSTFNDDEVDKFRLATKNCFKTEAEAEQRLSEIKKEYGIK